MKYKVLSYQDLETSLIVSTLNQDLFNICQYNAQLTRINKRHWPNQLSAYYITSATK